MATPVAFSRDGRRPCAERPAGMASTMVAPKVAPNSSSHRDMLLLSTETPSRLKRRSMRKSGSPSQCLATMMCASSEALATLRQSNSLGIAADSTAVSPSAPTVRYFARAMTRRTHSTALPGQLAAFLMPASARPCPP